MPLTLRLVKGSPLTYTELDSNFLFLTSSISSSLNNAVTGSANQVAVFSSTNKVTGSSNFTYAGGTLTLLGTTSTPVISTSTSGTGVYGQSDNQAGVYGKADNGKGVLGESANGVGVFATTTTGLAIQAEGPVQITGSLIASGSSHTITAPITNITSNTYTRIGGVSVATFETTRLFVQPAAKKIYTYFSGSYNGSLGLNVDFGNSLYQLGDFQKINNSNYISVDDSVAGSVVSIPSSSLQVGLGAVITGSLVASGSSHNIKGTTTISGSVNVSGSSHILRGNTTITGSLLVSAGITGSLSGSATNAVSSSYALTASYCLNAVSASYALTASYTPSPYTQAVLLVNQSGANNAPTLTTVYNNTGLTFTTSYTAIGSYEIIPSTPFSNVNKVTAAIHGNYAGGIIFTAKVVTVSDIQITTWLAKTPNQDFIDSRLVDTTLVIQIYN